MLRAGSASHEVEAVEHHHLVPGGDEVAHELPRGVVAGADLGHRPQLRVRSEDQVRPGCRPFGRATATGEGLLVVAGGSSGDVGIGDRREEVGTEDADRVGENPRRRAARGRAENPEAPTSTVISGALRVSRRARSTSRCWVGAVAAGPRWFRKPSAAGSSQASPEASVCSAEASVRPGVNGTPVANPASDAALSTAATPPSTIRSASEIRAAPPELNSCRTRSRVSRTLASCSGSFTAHRFIGASRKGGEAHLFQRHGAGEHHEVAPRELASALLLHRPEQAPGLVEAPLSGQAFSGANRCSAPPAPPRPSCTR